MAWEYLEAVIVKHWLPLLIGVFGSLPWWVRALLSDKLTAKMDEIFSPAAIKILGIICIAVAFVIANYFAWRDERLQVLTVKGELAEEKDKNIVKLSGEINQMTSGYDRGGEYIVLLTVSIINSGADSIVRNYRADVKIDGKEIKPKIVIISPDGLNLTDTKTGKIMITYSQSDAIYEKTTLPIKKGDVRTGVICFKFQESSNFKYKDGDWTLYFEDYLGKIYKVYAGANSRHESPLMYFPGSGGIGTKK